ncbi:DedA family protein [Nocardia sp. KC 131]|uniref:DedA family protein n=1 Tax=Nocardia arseniciresistens TaxID=3392119 RepID=UPI00398F279E
MACRRARDSRPISRSRAVPRFPVASEPRLACPLSGSAGCECVRGSQQGDQAFAGPRDPRTDGAAGDQASYRIGRHAGRPMLRRFPAGTKRHRAFGWVTGVLERRGPVFIVIGRFLPGLRSIMTLAAGAVAVPPRIFLAFDTLGALLWGVSGALLGYFGGNTFQDSPLASLAFVVVLVTLVIVLGEVGRRLQAPSTRTRNPHRGSIYDRARRRQGRPARFGET